MCQPLRICTMWISLLSPLTLGAEEHRAGQLSFGWAHESIVPNRPIAIGGQYHTRISSEVHDPLTVTALAIETRDDAGVIDQAVWVACDLVAIRRRSVQRVRALVHEALPDLDPQKIVLSATHTHTAPALTDADETLESFDPFDFLQSWAYRLPRDQPDVMRPLEYLDLL